MSQWIPSMLLESSAYSPFPIGGLPSPVPTAPTLVQPAISQRPPSWSPRPYSLHTPEHQSTVHTPATLVSFTSSSDPVTSAHKCSREPSAARVKPKLFGPWAQSNFLDSYSSNVLQVPYAPATQPSSFFPDTSSACLSPSSDFLRSFCLSFPPGPLA